MEHMNHVHQENMISDFAREREDGFCASLTQLTAAFLFWLRISHIVQKPVPLMSLSVGAVLCARRSERKRSGAHIIQNCEGSSSCRRRPSAACDRGPESTNHEVSVQQAAPGVRGTPVRKRELGQPPVVVVPLAPLAGSPLREGKDSSATKSK